MRILSALLAVILLAVTARAEEWTPLASNDSAVSIEYSKSSIEPVSATIKRARTRFVSKTGEPIPYLNVFSVVSELEFHCIQPLEKLISAEVVPSAGADPFQEKIESPVFCEIPHGSNSYLLWREVCFRVAEKLQ